MLPDLGLLLPALAAFEFLLAGLVLARGRLARLGHGLGIAFQVALAPLGFWWPANVLLAFGHAWHASVEFEDHAVSSIRRRLDPTG